ncbi:MAG: hypothetical protein CSB48_00195 [Proteobacteria bacterium]|nr:MAG: hypothetical protein CSB48_00195 [Pseudomonadota bacterium]
MNEVNFAKRQFTFYLLQLRQLLFLDPIYANLKLFYIPKKLLKVQQIYLLISQISFFSHLIRAC